MCYSKGEAEKESNLGTKEFDKKLENIHSDSKNNYEELFKQIGELNAEVEGLIPLLLQEINKTSKNNKCNVTEYEEKMSRNYPVYFDDYKNERIPMLKIPSVQIVINSIDHSYIDYLKIKKMAMRICKYVDVARNDIENIRSDKQVKSDIISIMICCKYDSLKENVIKIKEELIKFLGANKFCFKLHPWYLVVPANSIKVSLDKKVEYKNFYRKKGKQYSEIRRF